MEKVREPKLEQGEFVKRLEWVREDFDAGLMSPAEFGMLCEKLACERMGIEFEWPEGWDGAPGA